MDPVPSRWQLCSAPDGIPLQRHHNRLRSQASPNELKAPLTFLSRQPFFSISLPLSAFANSLYANRLQYHSVQLFSLVSVRIRIQVVGMASDGPALERSGEVRERPSLEGKQQQEQPHHDTTGLHRTAEIHETESGNVELRQDPHHTSKPLANVDPEKILDPRGASVATKPEDILEVRRAQTDTHLE